MSKNLPVKFTKGTFGLARSQDFRKSAFARSRVNRVKLEKDRLTLEENLRKIEVFFDCLMRNVSVDGGELSADDREKYLNMMNILNVYTVAKGVLHLSDYLCIQEPCNIRDKDGEKKRGHRRISIAEMTDQIEFAFYGDEEEQAPGILAEMDMMTAMLNDVGNKQLAWIDESGYHNPAKYFTDTPKPVDPNAPPPEEKLSEISEEEGGVTDEEVDRAANVRPEVP